MNNERQSRSIDESLIENKEYFNHVKDDITCAICLGILNEPLLCKKCETPFCKVCINKWKEKNESCPNRCSTIILVEVHRLLKNTLDKIKLNLPCGCYLSLLNYNTHITPCTLEKETCMSCLKRKSTGLSEKVDDHLKFKQYEDKIKEMEEDSLKNDERISFLIKELKVKNDELKLLRSESDIKIAGLETELKLEKIKNLKLEDEITILNKKCSEKEAKEKNEKIKHKKINSLMESTTSIIEVEGIDESIMDQICGKIKENKNVDIQIPTMENKKSISIDNEIYCLMMLQINKKAHVAVGSDTSKHVQVYSMDTYEIITTIIDEESGIECIASLNYNNQTLIVSGGMKGVKLWNSETGKHFMTLSGKDEEPVDSLFVYPLNKEDVIITGFDDGVIKIWNPFSKIIVMILEGHSGPIQALTAFTINNQVIVVSGGEEGNVKLCSTSSEKLMMTFEEKVSSDILDEIPGVYCLVTFAIKDKIIVASGGKEACIKLWSFNEKKLIRKLEGHDSGDDSCVYSLVMCFFNKQLTLISGGYDAKIKVWEPESGKLLLSLNNGYYEPVMCLVSYKDNNKNVIVSGGSDGTLKIWN